MPQDDLSGVIKLIIESNSQTSSSSAGGTSPSSGQSSAGTAGGTTNEKKALKFYENIDKGINNTTKFLAGGGLLSVLAKYSQAANAVLNGILDIVGAVVDMFLIPSMPLFAKIFEKIAPLMPVLMDLFDQLITPIIDALIPLVETSIPLIIEVIEQIAPLLKPMFDQLGIIIKALVDSINWIIGKSGGPIMVGKQLSGAASIMASPITQGAQTFSNYDPQRSFIGQFAENIGKELLRSYHLMSDKSSASNINKNDAPITFNIQNNLELGNVSDVNYLSSMLGKQVSNNLTSVARRN